MQCSFLFENRSYGACIVDFLKATEDAQPVFSAKEASVIRRKLEDWFQSHGRDLPWRRTHDPYAILVSEFMLQQTTVAAVIPYYKRWMKRFPDVKALAAADEQTVLAHWQGLGYYARARNLRKAAKAVAQGKKAEFPRDPESLRKLPGVGPYTAGAVAAFAFDIPCVVIDANIARVLARLADMRRAIDTTLGRAELESVAKSLLPSSGGSLHTSSLMELGALVCTARNPNCPSCPVRTHCRTKEPEKLPLKSPRRKTELLIEDHVWLTRGARVLLQACEGKRWKGLWILPELAENSSPETAPAFEIPYAIMHYRARLRVYLKGRPANKEALEAFSFDELSGIPMPTPHRKALARLMQARQSDGK